ncbi:MAG TPA: polyphosphate kinase 2 family protein [Gemmatimonadaceae bacterium]|nr:polyphosphate kinase 2 family protein [Gemmatimonadaceae bacterium]
MALRGLISIEHRIMHIKRYRVTPGRPFRRSGADPDDHGGFKNEADAFERTEAHIARLNPLQERLYAEGKRSLLIILQAIDTGGKDGTIRHVMRGINPQGCNVTSFKAPTPEERSHDFLWRIHRAVPAKGMIGIFNRSHYEDVLVTRVHGDISRAEAGDRFREINAFERELVQNGTTILKFYLAISKDEQRRRLQARVDDPQKRWKFSTGDLAERRYWDKYMRVYADACSATSTKHAPWYVIPANHKWYRNYLVAKIVAATLEKMDPQFPSSRGPSHIRVK